MSKAGPMSESGICYQETAGTQYGLIQAGFVLTGVVTTLLGPMIPILTAKWRIGDGESGYLFTAQFLGALSATLTTGWLFARLGYIRPIAIAFFLMSTGTAALGLAPWPVGLGAVFIYGLGLGVVIPGINLYVAHSVTERRASALNTLNFLWGVGAVSGPPLMAWLCRTYGILPPHLLLATLLTLTAFLILRGYRGSASGGGVRGRAIETQAVVSGWAPAVLIALFIFLYVGMENSVGGWAATYAGRITNWPENAWPLATLAFWGALMAGRGIAPPVLKRINEARLILFALSAAVAGNLVIVGAFSGASLLSGILIAGFGFATIYPMTVASLSRLYGGGSATVASFVFGMAALGGATLPWAVGRLSATLGSLRLGLLVPLIASLGMFGLHSAISAASRSAAER
jgi:fucose permease